MWITLMDDYYLKADLAFQKDLLVDWPNSYGIFLIYFLNFRVCYNLGGAMVFHSRILYMIV